MANFQFTVRATDSDGAYADRNFAITINNTRVERYMVIDNFNAYTSPDLVNWTTRNGQGGWDCVYGNSMWLIMTNNTTPQNSVSGGYFLGGGSYTGANTMVVRKSTDGVNYANLTYAAGQVKFVNNDANSTAFVPSSNVAIYGRLSFSNGYFWLPITWSSDFTQPTAIQSYVARSADGVTWTILPVPAKGNFFYHSSLGHFYRLWAKVQDSGSDIFIPNYGSANGYTANFYGWKSSDLGVTWVPVIDSTGKANNNTSYFSPMVTRINGLYLAAHNQTANVPFMISNDGLNWSPCNPVANWNSNWPIHSVTYANGTLYAVGSYFSTATVSPILLQSTDGVTWTQVSLGSNVLPGGSTGFNPYTGLTYKNGFLVLSNNGTSATSQKPFSFVFAGSGDTFSYPSTPQSATSTGAQIPFNYANGFAAMGS